MKVAYLASKATLPSSPERREDYFEHVHMMENLRPAFVSHGATLEDVAWDDAAVDWSAFDAAIIGTTWDYWDRLDDYISTLGEIEKSTRLFNSLKTVKWNIRKTYLRDLGEKGAKLIPTLWLDKADDEAVMQAFEDLQTDDLILKRQVGAGADGQHRLQNGAPIPEMPEPMMAQPFLPAIQREGEMSLIFIDGAFCHALIKRPAADDYRIQSIYGGRENAITPSTDDLDAARRVLDALDETPLYARVDMVRGPDGALLLMELELIEPYLYPQQGPNLGEQLYQAIKKRL